MCIIRNNPIQILEKCSLYHEKITFQEPWKVSGILLLIYVGHFSSSLPEWLKTSYTLTLNSFFSVEKFGKTMVKLVNESPLMGDKKQTMIFHIFLKFDKLVCNHLEFKTRVYSALKI